MDNPEDWSQSYVIIARPELNAFAITRGEQVFAFADTYPKIEAIYKALVFSEKIDELATRTSKEYR